MSGKRATSSPPTAQSSAVAHWHRLAKASRTRVVLADAADRRAISAAERIGHETAIEAITLGDGASFDEICRSLPDDARRAARAVLTAVGDRTNPDDPLSVAAALVRSGWADAGIGGASRPTADVVRAGLRIIGTAPGITTVSSAFFFVFPDGRPVVYGDCGVVPDPDAHQLASIAVSCASTFAELAHDEPVVALLSFSTKGSARHARVDKVIAATRLARSLAPTLRLDGELQFDAAFEPTVAAAKAPDSPVAGLANVFVFPDLDSGNIAYKITERVGHARAFGPLLQGLDGVFHDLSRGCSTDDIVNVALIAAVQSLSRRSR